MADKPAAKPDEKKSEVTTMATATKSTAEKAPAKTVNLTAPGGAKVTVGAATADRLKARGYK